MNLNCEATSIIEANDDRFPVTSTTVVVVPTFNEQRSIVSCLHSLLASDSERHVIIVADGGSTDDTRRLVREIADSNTRLLLVSNPGRTQAHALNMVASALPSCCKWMIRADAHSLYPSNFVDALLEARQQREVSSVVVPMQAVGRSCFEKAAAYAQNSIVGNGGSRHRRGCLQGAFVDHGHHALFDLEAFRALGGYDEGFRFNEDFELDHRIRSSGGRLWLSEKVVVRYIPRSSLTSLATQYFNHGSGRAKSVVKHRLVPKLRQLSPVIIFWSYPAAACLWPWTFSALIIPAVHLTLCAMFGVMLAARRKDRCAILAGIAAAAMHIAWGAGFSREFSRLFLQSASATAAAKTKPVRDRLSSGTI